MRRGKLQQSTSIQFPKGKTIPSLDQEQDYKYLGIAQADNIKHEEMKAKVKKEYAARVRKILSSN